MQNAIDRHFSRWFLRFGVLFCLALVYLVTHAFLVKFEEHYDSEVNFKLQLPLDPEAITESSLLTTTPKVEKVFVAGFFNDWSENDSNFELHKVNENTWQNAFQLAPGRNQYKFVLHLKNDANPVWIRDFANPHKTEDSHGNYNSYTQIPNIQYYQNLLDFVSAWALLFILFYYLAEPILYWVLHRPIPFRYKLNFSLVLVVVFSNIGFIAHHVYSNRIITRQSVIDNIHLVHLSITANNNDIASLIKNPLELKEALHSLFWPAAVRVEKQSLSPNQITLSNFAVFDKDFNLIHLQHRHQNAALQLDRALQLGFQSTEEYFLNGLLAPAIEKAKHQKRLETVFAHPTDHAQQVETHDTYISRTMLGFNSFIHPIVLNSQHIGYYGGTVQVKLYGREVKNTLLTSLTLVVIVSIFCALLFANIGRLITNHLDNLARWTRYIIKGEVSNILEINTRDEIQDLAENFQEMHNALEKSFEEIEEKNLRLEFEAYIDALTALPNRKKMLLDIDKMEVFAIVLLNIDEFRSVNDFFGNEVGDQILLSTSERLKSYCSGRQLDIYRIGSDEFSILIKKEMNRDQCEQLATELCNQIKDIPFRTQRNEIYVSISAGIAIKETSSAVDKPLFLKAEIALRQAKSRLTNFLIYDTSMESFKRFESNMSWTNRLRLAIDEDRIVPFFQPIINNTTGEIEKYECLVRLITEDGEIISPIEFLDIARKARFYPFITQIMLKKSFEKFKDSALGFTLNLSIDDILDHRTNRSIIHQLQHDPDIAKRATFEILETDEIKNYELIRKFVNEVKSLGSKIAIDDFGSGYSNFAHILSLNIDYLKVDGALIKSLDTDKNAQAITKTIVQFSQEMDILTIAEFVHNETIFELAKEFGISYSQGFYLGKPSPDLVQ